MEENESESMEEYEKYLQEAKFRMKNNKYDNRDNVNCNFLGINDINNINIGSSVATAAFNNGINSLNNNYHFSNSIDGNKLNNFQSGEIKDENFKESPLISSKNNNIKGSIISMKDIILKKSSSIKIDPNIYDSINNNLNNNINNDINNNINDNINNNINNNLNKNLNNNLNNNKNNDKNINNNINNNMINNIDSDNSKELTE